ncbi:MAG TPA: hypothetical protein V6C72_13510, partial [Chroococcales cyanobacterium]
MKTQKFALGLSLLMAAGTMLPALAGDGGLDTSVDGCMLVTRVAGSGVGLVVGTPIAVVRHTSKEYVAMTSSVADKIGGH